MATDDGPLSPTELLMLRVLRRKAHFEDGSFDYPLIYYDQLQELYARIHKERGGIRKNLDDLERIARMHWQLDPPSNQVGSTEAGLVPEVISPEAQMAFSSEVTEIAE
jgi:hypothetical protein